MKTFITFALGLLLIPQFALADITPPPDEGPKPFLEATTLSLEIAADDTSLADLATTSLASGTHTFAYAFAPEESWFYDPSNELTDEDRARIWSETLRDYKAYLSLWRGSPLTESAELVEHWDVSGVSSGSVTATLTESGSYFFLVDIPDYVLRNPEAECARYEDPVELCLPVTTLGMSLEEAWAYLKSPYAETPHPNGGVYLPKAFGGVRFALEGETVPSGASSVLFLPGIQGSRLYEKVLGVENKRWELTPFMSQVDAKALYLNPDGTSTNDIYTKEGEAVASVELLGYGLDVYRTFFDQLASLEQDDTIRDYHIFPYDWRMSPRDVVEAGTPYDDGTRFVSDEVERLAQGSATGKVTLVGHSNGGLVAKALMQKLEREGKAHLVDTVVLIGVPQLGTPQALSPMLHGDYGILTSYGGFYLTKPNARGLSEYMPDAYALLPSEEYFESAEGPIVNLTRAPELRAASGLSSPTITNHADLKRFLTLRSKPGIADIETPNALSSHLLSQAEALHESLDQWTAPQGVRLVQVAGGNLPTMQGLSYEERKEKECTLFVIACRDVTKLTHRAHFTDGDGTVVSTSEAPMDVETYFVNLYEANDVHDKNWKHANVTESAPFQELFPSLLSSSTVSLPPHVTRQESGASGKRLEFRALSPVTLDAYDSLGRQTGTGDMHGDMGLAYESIPNSYYAEYGEGKYVGMAPNDEVTIRLRGTDNGTFTFIAESIDGEVREAVTYGDIPVTPSTTATIVVREGDIENAVMQLDLNNDDISEAVLTPSSAMDPLAYLGVMRAGLATLTLDPKFRAQLEAKLWNIEQVLLKSGKWDDRDDDKDRNDLKKGEKQKDRAVRKVGKIERWVMRQLPKVVPAKGVASVGAETTIDSMTAETLLTMTDRLRTLLTQ